MKRRLLTIVVGLAALAGSTLISASPATAGSNGQQLFFYRYSGKSAISYLRVDGRNQANQSRTWSRSFNPAVTSFNLDNWWWKGTTDVQWRLADGRTGSCTFIVPTQQSGSDWKQVGVDRQPGNVCWFS